MGSRGVYHDGWMASAFGPRAPWISGMPDISKWQPDKDEWELYNATQDWLQADDLANKMPEKLADLKDLFLIELTKNKGLPIGGALYVTDFPGTDHAHDRIRGADPWQQR
jgi:arylsulfatase A-like enzyme